NTFGANTFSLADMKTVLRVIDAGCECAKAAADSDTLIFASLGPILYDDQARCDAERRHIIDRFAANGITNFLFETFAEAPVLKTAAEYIKSICPDAYVIAECSVAPDAYTQNGISAQSIIDELQHVSAIDAYGFNCTCGPMHMVHVIAETDFYGKTVSAMPNAGYPTVTDGRTVFKSSPAYFAEQIVKLRQAGARIWAAAAALHPRTYARQASRLQATAHGL
ncbi:MAG: homocysteine S-methyltransferase family protein, partial [Christensenella sp.]